MSHITLTHNAVQEPTLVDVPEAAFLAIDGHGAPEGQAFETALFTLIGAGMRIGATGPVEGLYWTGTPTELDHDDPAGWSWTLMIRVPDDAPAPMAPVELRRTAEGLSVQILHVGPYDAEGPTIERLMAWISGHGYARAGAHHEIYLDSPRTTPPERLRTIIRQPVRDA